MSKTLTGNLYEPDGSGVVGTLRFKAMSNNSDNSLSAGTIVDEELGADGAYSLTLLDGVYNVKLIQEDTEGREFTVWSGGLTVTSSIDEDLLVAMGAQGTPGVVGSSVATLVPETVAGTSYTLDQGDSGKALIFTSNSAVTVTLPNSLTAGFNCLLVQQGSGAVGVVAASGATLRNRQSHDGIAGQYGNAALIVTANSNGASAVYYLTGDTA